MPIGAIETGVAGAELMVKVPVSDQSVFAFVVGEARPCCESTRQNLGPEVSDSITWVGSVYWLKNHSMFENPGSVATSRT